MTRQYVPGSSAQGVGRISVSVIRRSRTLRQVTPSAKPAYPLPTIVRYAASRFFVKAAVSNNELVALLRISRCLM